MTFYKQQQCEVDQLHDAAYSGDMEKVREILECGKCTVNCTNSIGWTPLHWACFRGNMHMVRVLISEFKADMTIQATRGDTPLMLATKHKQCNVVDALLSDSHCLVDAKGLDGYTALHYSCKHGHIDIVRTLVKHKANVNARTDSGDTPLIIAAVNNHDNIVHALLSDSQCSVSTNGENGYTALHYSCKHGHIDIVRTLVKHKANVNARTDSGDTPLAIAADNKHDNIVHTLSDYNCEVHAKDKDAYTALFHTSCERGYAGIVKILLTNHKADIYLNAATPLTLAIRNKHDNVVHALLQLSDYQCLVDAKSQDGYTALHDSCRYGHVDIVRTILKMHKADINARTDSGDTPLTLAIRNKHDNVVHVLSDYNCGVYAKDTAALLHLSCRKGYVGIVRIILTGHKDDMNAITKSGDTPLHVAALYGQLQVTITLINEFNCDIHVKGHMGRSLLHSACAGYQMSGAVVEYVGRYLSPLLVDNDGNTPLHTACLSHNMAALENLLKYNPPMLVRNKNGQTPLDLATPEVKDVFNKYIIENKDKIYADYNSTLAKKKYSSAEPITRIFVIGNPGAGKSSLVETLKREGFFESFRRVSESSVPLHTAGIVPSIHTSKHYGRSLFYDFAGDPEYYSSHAAILENLVSSRKGNNIFVIVVDLREENIKEILYYWLMFIQHQNLGWKEPFLIIIGSHSDKMAREKVEDKKMELQKFCDKIQPGHGVLHKVAHFILDCRNPKHQHLGDIQKLIASFTKDSPHHGDSRGEVHGRAGEWQQESCDHHQK